MLGRATPARRGAGGVGRRVVMTCWATTCIALCQNVDVDRCTPWPSSAPFLAVASPDAALAEQLIAVRGRRAAWVAWQRGLGPARAPAATRAWAELEALRSCMAEPCMVEAGGAAVLRLFGSTKLSRG